MTACPHCGARTYQGTWFSRSIRTADPCPDGAATIIPRHPDGSPAPSDACMETQ